MGWFSDTMDLVTFGGYSAVGDALGSISSTAQAANELAGITSGYSDPNTSTQERAVQQMEFQERMSSTAYQRAAKDLEAAGLSRMLAIGSPASSPAGAQGAVIDRNVSRAHVQSLLSSSAASQASAAKSREEGRHAKIAADYAPAILSADAAHRGFSAHEAASRARIAQIEADWLASPTGQKAYQTKKVMEGVGPVLNILAAGVGANSAVGAIRKIVQPGKYQIRR